MPVPTIVEKTAKAEERVPASPSEGTPARPAETTSPGGHGGEEEESGGASSPAGSGSLSTECRAELENSREDAGDKQAAKIFIGGLNWQTTTETLKEFFETNFGAVSECNIMKDQSTKKSRGFGFITFTKSETVDRVLKTHEDSPIHIDDKQIDPKIAVPPKKANNRVSPQVHVKRIFVGGLSSETTEEDMKEYFEEFGEVTEVQLLYDRSTNRHRGFGFVSFEEEEPADKVCSIQFHDIRGKRVEVKVAQTKEEMSRTRNPTNRTPAPNYSYPVSSFGPYYHSNYHYEMGMGYVPGPMVYPHQLKMRGTRRDFHGGPTYYGGFVEQRAPPMHGYYTAAAGPGYGGIPVPHMMRGGPHYIDHPQIIHNVDYVTDHFQGMGLNSRGSSYTSGTHSPPYPQSYDGPSGAFEASGGNNSSASSTGSGSYSPTNNGSPTGNIPPSVNGYSQVPTFTGSPPSSYAVSY